MPESTADKKARVEAEEAKQAQADQGRNVESTASAKGGKLKVSVTVHADRGPVTYQAGETPKPEHVELITNPDVWDDGSEDDS
jgi:hypothetical protein